MKRSLPTVLARLTLIAGALLLSTTGLGACANVIGLDGVEYDRRQCGADSECTPPSICRGNANGTFYCEPPPATGAKFGESAYPVVDGKKSTLPNCLSGVDDGTFCTRPCRGNPDCGGTLPFCKGLSLKVDGSRIVTVCQKTP